MGLKRVKVVFGNVLFIFITLIFIILLPRIITSVYAIKRSFSITDAPEKPIGIVFGAGLWRDGSPTPVLRDRVSTGAQLYFAGKISKLLMSGDNSYIDYNEPEAMRQYALELGVPDEDIVLDYAGRRSYDTCYRAKEIFGIRDAILITQQFHLTRVIYLCNKLGINGVGVSADLRTYRFPSYLYWQIREIPATLVAMWEVNISHPKPILGNPEPIFPEEN